MTQHKSRDEPDPAEPPRTEPDTEGGDTQEAPIGDPKPASEVPEKFPGRREREPGTTGDEA